MEDEQTEQQPQYRFPWEHLVDCLLTSEDGGHTYDCALSRAHIYDYDLSKKSERPKQKDSAIEAFSDLSIASSSTSQEQTDSGPVDGDIEMVPELNSSAWAEIPKQFGNPKKMNRNGGPSYRKRKTDVSEKKTWLNNASFDEYWQYYGSYLIYKTWLCDFGDEMSTVDRENLEQTVLDTTPEEHSVCLLEEHCDIENKQNYQGLSKNHQSFASQTSFVDIFHLHCQLVKERSEKDFALFKAAHTANRCTTFFKKIENMGFISGFTNKKASPEKLLEKGEITEADPAPIKKKKSSYTGERFPVVYGAEEVFGDISYDVYEPYATQMRVVLDRSRATQSDSGVEVKDEQAMEEPSEPIDIKNITFAFDPEKESYLIARNACDYYKQDPEIRKYFFQRYRLFSKLDKGVLMDREGWFSVTPERIAEHIADRMVSRNGLVIVDAFAGVGGNSIQFALKGAHVFAIDLDPVRLKCARENAKVYGVEDKIEFLCCDFFHFAAKWMKKQAGEQTQIDGVFLSPPWGGPSYLKTKEFDLGKDLTPNGFDIFTAARSMSPNIAYFLPRNTSMKQLVSLAGPGGRCEVEQSCLNKKIKTITAYYGDLSVQREV